MSTLDNELEILRRTPRAPLDTDWLTGGKRYEVTDTRSPWNVLPQINEQFAANRAGVLADPRLLRESLSREQQSVTRAVLRALHEGLMGPSLRERLIQELGGGTISKNIELIKSLVAANEGKAGVYLLDPLACWPSCGDVVHDVGTLNPLGRTIRFIKANSACVSCRNRQGNRCAACHMDLISSCQDLPSGTLENVSRSLMAASVTPDRVRVAAAAVSVVDGLSERERVELFVKDVFSSRIAAPVSQTPFSVMSESELPVDVVAPTASAHSDSLVAVSASELEENVVSSVPPKLLDMSDNLEPARCDDCFDEEPAVDVELTPKKSADTLSVSLDDNMDVTL